MGWGGGAKEGVVREGGRGGRETDGMVAAKEEGLVDGERKGGLFRGKFRDGKGLGEPEPC